MDEGRVRFENLRKPGPVSPSNDRRTGIAVFVLCGLGLLGVNHLSVVFGQGLRPEAMIGGTTVLIMGLTWAVLPGGLDVIERWIRVSLFRAVGFALVLLAAGAAAAEGLARWWYGESLIP